MCEVESGTINIRCSLFGPRLECGIINAAFMPCCNYCDFEMTTHDFLGLLDHGTNHNHDYFGQYCNHDYLT